MKAFFFGAKGGAVELVVKDTGEVVASFPCSPGLHPVSRFAPFRGRGCELVGPVIETRGNMEGCQPVGRFDSSANPFFRVSPMQRQMREMANMLKRTEAIAKRTAKVAKQMARGKAAPAQLPAPAAASGGDDAESVSAS